MVVIRVIYMDGRKRHARTGERRLYHKEDRKVVAKRHIPLLPDAPTPPSPRLKKKQKDTRKVKAGKEEGKSEDIAEE